MCVDLMISNLMRVALLINRDISSIESLLSSPMAYYMKSNKKEVNLFVRWMDWRKFGAMEVRLYDRRSLQWLYDVRMNQEHLCLKLHTKIKQFILHMIR
jgi:hypothetical protein